MSMIPWLMWIASLVVGAVNCYIVCVIIEKTGLERLGATGSLFKYEKDEAAKTSKEENK